MWVNKNVVYKKHESRPAIVDEEIFYIKLKKGTNKILVKIENIGANWGLYLRIIDADNELKIVDFSK